MPKAVSANEAKTHFGELLDYVGDHADGVIVERRGQPTAVLMSIDAYEEVRAWREQQHRDEALAQLRDLREKVSERAGNLSLDEAELVAERLSQEALRRMAKRGELLFERNRR